MPLQLASEGSSVDAMGAVARDARVARVVGRRDVGGEMVLIALDVPDELRESYVRPGQYAHFTLAGEGGYFVLGNRERRAPWEIFLRRGGGVADLLHSTTIGAEVEATHALGTGYPVDEARGADVVMLVTAGAIAAARATIARRIEDGDAARTHLLVGARTETAIPLRDELEQMRAAGVTMHVVLSREGTDAARRYVQHALEREWTSRAWIFVAGADAMIADVRAAALALGAPTARVISNV